MLVSYVPASRCALTHLLLLVLFLHYIHPHAVQKLPSPDCNISVGVVKVWSMLLSSIVFGCSEALLIILVGFSFLKLISVCSFFYLAALKRRLYKDKVTGVFMFWRTGRQQWNYCMIRFRYTHVGKGSLWYEKKVKFGGGDRGNVENRIYTKWDTKKKKMLRLLTL
jgi:hypothetical protein